MGCSRNWNRSAQHDIPYDRHSDAKYEFDVENVHFRPGMKETLVTPSDSNNNAMVRMDAVRPFAEELAKLATTTMTKEKLLAAVKKMSKRLNKVLLPEVEPLPPLEIVWNRTPWETTMKVRFSNIEWDLDGEQPSAYNLPTECVMEVDNDVDLEEEGADVLSDQYGWCVKSCSFEIIG